MPAVQDSIDAIRIAAAAADRMKATDIVAFDVTEPLAITDLMMIASASNERQVLAVAEEIEKDLYLKDGKRQPRFTSCIRSHATSIAWNDCGRIARTSTSSSTTRRTRRRKPSKRNNPGREEKHAAQRND